MKTRILSGFKSMTRRAWLVALAGFCLMTLTALAAAPDLDKDHPKVKEAMGLQNAMTPGLMKLEGILGTATGLDDEGNVAIVVYVNKHSPRAPEIVGGMPKAVKNVPMRVEVTEPFRAFAPPAGKGGGGGDKISHTAKQTAPIQLGTSGGWRYDLANGYCCAGTLGSLIQVNGVQYILSNYHVLEADIVNGGNSRTAQDGDNVIQPGLIDVGCNAANAQNVAKLVKINSLPNSNVDAAIAQVIGGMVKTDGSILEIGPISSQTVAASLNQKVKKSGRTTKLTRSTVAGFNATISVAYDNECAGGAAFTKTFTGQIVIANRGSRFLAGGDSGSLMVEDVATNPKAVGLLYAGSSSSAIANPIDEVLTFIGGKLGGEAKMVGTP